MTEERMPNFWWCPTHHLYRGGDKRPCADAVRLVPAPPAPQQWQMEARIKEQRATSLGYCEHIVETYPDGEEGTCSNLRLRGQVHCEEHVADLDRLRAAMVEADRNYQPPSAPEPGADRWVHLRNTCPHGIVRGLITCPVCEPEKQAAAEASARAAVVAQPDEGGEYPCSNCGTRGWDCLTAMNASPVDRRRCEACGVNRTHSRPRATSERAIPEPTEGQNHG